MKDKFRFNDLLTKSNRTEIQTYKVEERTFGTPCSRQEEEIFTDKCWNVSKKALAQVAAGNALKFFFSRIVRSEALVYNSFFFGTGVFRQKILTQTHQFLARLPTCLFALLLK